MKRGKRRYYFGDYEYSYYDQGWNSGLEDLIAEDCGYADKMTPVVKLSPTFEAKAYALIERLQNEEFLAYCIGTKEVNKDEVEYHIADLYIPHQKVSYSTVEVTEVSLPEHIDILGTVHSHGDFDSFISNIDERSIRSNYEVTIVVGRLGQDWLAEVRMMVPCGLWHWVKAKVQFERLKLNDPNFLEEIERKIQVEKRSIEYKRFLEFERYKKNNEDEESAKETWIS